MELNPEEFFVAELFHSNTKQEKQVFLSKMQRRHADLRVHLFN
jgi:hypothetical protein